MISKRTGWKPLQIFIAFFAICFAVGFFRGQSDSHSERCLGGFLLTYSKVVNVNPFYYLNGGSPRFVYSFPNYPYRIVYDLSPVQPDEGFDRRLLDTLPPFYDAFHGEWMGRPMVELLDDGAALTLKDTVKSISEAEAASPGPLKRALSKGIGIVSGYSLGYRQASSTDLDPRESRLVEPYFNQKEHQARLKRLVWLQKYYLFQNHETHGQTEAGNRGPSFGPVTGLFEKTKLRMDDPAIELQNVDFQALDEFIQISTKGTSPRERMFVEFVGLPSNERIECCNLYQATRRKNAEVDRLLLDWASNAYLSPGVYTNGLLKARLAQMNKITEPGKPSDNPGNPNKP